MAKKLKIPAQILRCFTVAFGYLREEAQKTRMNRDLGIWVLLFGDEKTTIPKEKGVTR